MPRPLLLLLPVALFGLAVPLLGGHAAERSLRLGGSDLVIDDPCARQVTITADPALHGQVVVEARAGHAEELDRLVFESRGRVRIRPVVAGTRCWQPSPGALDPTLHLALRVPEGFGLAIDEPGFGSYAIGATGTLTLDLSGAGAVTVARVAGDASIDLSGSATVMIAQADMDRLTTGLSGAGGVTVLQGRVGQASLDDSGTGTIRIGARTRDATVDLSGVGSVRFAVVTGTLRKDVSGAGSVSVGGAAPD
jgi:hypothetical protein